MTQIEQQLRTVARQAPAPTSDWLESLESQARGPHRSARRKGPVFAAGLIAVALAGGVLAVALRRPEAAPTPADTAPTVPQQTTAKTPTTLAEVMAQAGSPATLGPDEFDAAALAQIVPGTVRTIATIAPGVIVRGFTLRNGATCLGVSGYADCTVPADGRHILALENFYGPASPETEVPVVAIVTPDVVSVTMTQKGRRIELPLHNGVGMAMVPENHIDYHVTLTDGTTLKVGPPWAVAPQPPRAPAPSGPGREFSDDILKTAGQPAELPDGFLPKLPPELEKVRPNEPNPGSVRLLAADYGAAHTPQYAWTNGKDVCIANGSVCGIPMKVHILWLPGGWMYADSILGIAAKSVRRAWVQLPDGSRIDATIDHQVVTATIPPERAAPVHLYAELTDGTVIDERPELLG